MRPCSRIYYSSVS